MLLETIMTKWNDKLFAQLVAIVLVVFQVELCKSQCIQNCVEGMSDMGELSPNKGGPDCFCTAEAYPPGCKVKPCRSGEDSNLLYTCACTPENHPYECVKLRCSNGTHCNEDCECVEQPPFCTEDSKNPIRGNPDCTCTPEFWPTGCTLAPCKSGDTVGENTYFCECTPDNSPDFCYKPHCSHRIEKDDDVIVRKRAQIFEKIKA